MDAYEMILSRRSVRKYMDQPIEKKLLEKLAAAGMCSPSARNNRPWEFMVITDKGLLTELSKVRPYWKMLEGAGAAIVVLKNSIHYTSPTVEFSIQDCAAATENVLLAAHAEGLGAVWLGLYPLEEEQKGVREILHIPDNIQPFAVVSLGYPEKEAPAAERFEAEKLHWNQYGNGNRGVK